MIAAVLVEDLRRRGVTIVADGGLLRCRPRSTLSKADLDLLRLHKKEILSLLAAAPVERTYCFCCRRTRFWRSIHGIVVCATCHPPAKPGLVAEWIGEGSAS